MQILAIIPARGGSKGIPGKNIRPLLGKPLLAYSIEQARQTAAIDRVVVSTDDDQIAAVAREYKAEVITRPAEISGDEATSESALVHALDHLKESRGYEPSLVVFLQATSPIRRPDDIKNALELLVNQEADSLFSASPMHGFVWRRYQGELNSFTYDYRHRQRRQDAPQDFVENGSIYIFKPWVLRRFNNRLGGNIAMYEMDTLHSFQVDEPGDLALMEQLLSSPATPAMPDLSAVQLLVLDFDGVLTDNRAWVNQDGTESVAVHRSDGWGIARLKEAGVDLMVLSTEQNPVVAARCRKLALPHIQGCDDKLTALKEIAIEHDLQPHDIAYVGNDVNDLDAMRWAGLPIAVADAEPEIKMIAKYITRRPGGRGAIREIARLMLK